MVTLGIPCNFAVEKKTPIEIQLFISVRFNWNQWVDKTLAYRKLKMLLVRREGK